MVHVYSAGLSIRQCVQDLRKRKGFLLKLVKKFFVIDNIQKQMYSRTSRRSYYSLTGNVIKWILYYFFKCNFLK